MSPYRFRASAAERWVNCPGSVALCESVPPGEETEVMRLGSEAHARLATALKTHSPVGLLPDSPEWDAYVWMVENYLDREGWTWYFEEEVNLASYGFPEIGGTCDIAGHNKDWSEMFIADFKSGKNYEYQTLGNKQLLIYAAGFCSSRPYPTAGVRTAIIQPAIGAPILINKTVADMDSEIPQITGPAIQGQGIAPYVTGPWCDWCDAHGVCPEVHKTALVPVEKLNMVGVKQLTPKQLGKIVVATKPLLKFVEKANAHALRLSLGGVHIPGCKNVLTKPHRQWADNAEKVFRDASLLIQDTHTIKLKSWNQIKEQFGAGFMKKPAIAALVVQPPGKPTIAPLSDKRPEYSPPTAEDVFQIEKEEE